jgi:hypothetical protein
VRNALIANPTAEAYDPLKVRALQRLKEARQAQRSVKRSAL